MGVADGKHDGDEDAKADVGPGDQTEYKEHRDESVAKLEVDGEVERGRE